MERQFLGHIIHLQVLYHDGVGNSPPIEISVIERFVDTGIRLRLQPNIFGFAVDDIHRLKLPHHLAHWRGGVDIHLPHLLLEYHLAELKAFFPASISATYSGFMDRIKFISSPAPFWVYMNSSLPFRQVPVSDKPSRQCRAAPRSPSSRHQRQRSGT